MTHNMPLCDGWVNIIFHEKFGRFLAPLVTPLSTNCQTRITDYFLTIREGVNPLQEESRIERWLGRNVRAIGCLYYKFVSPGNAGVPDRLLILPDGKVWFVEIKDEKGKLSQQQIRQQDRMRAAGATVYTIYGMDGARKLADKILQAIVQTDK